MKLAQILFSSLLVALLLSFSSCTKDEFSDRTLWRGNGTWKIETFSIQTIDDDGTVVSEETEKDAGSFVFKRNGSGNYAIEIGITEIGSFSYSVAEDYVTFVINDEVNVFERFEGDNDHMTLVYRLPVGLESGTGAIVETYALVKD
jgi:hypothetical protein